MNPVQTTPVRFAACALALLLLSPLVLPLAATLSAEEHMSGAMDREMDMSGDMPCPPRGVEISTCCMQTGVISSAPAMPHRLQASLHSPANALETGRLTGSLRAPLAERTQWAHRHVHITGSDPAIHLLNASFLL